MSGTSNPVAVSGREVGRSSFRDLRSEPRESDSPFSLLAPSFLSLLAVPRSSPGTFKEVNIHRLLLPFLQHPIQSLSCVLRSFLVCLLFSISVSLSFPLFHRFSLSRAPSFITPFCSSAILVAVWSRQARGRPFSVKHDLRRELRPD